MVRVNLIQPTALADQHLIAEYNEILMLLGYVRKHPEPSQVPQSYRLGPGHIRFFKDKLLYIKKRHELLKEEMRRRGFRPEKTIDLTEFSEDLRKDWEPREEDAEIIKKRLIEKIRMRPSSYRYEGEHRPARFFIDLIQNANL